MTGSITTSTTGKFFLLNLFSWALSGLVMTSAPGAFGSNLGTGFTVFLLLLPPQTGSLKVVLGALKAFEAVGTAEVVA